MANQLCSEAHLASIAESIVDWREVSPYLNLTEAEECEILGSNPHSVSVQKIAMLRKWKQKKGEKATYKRLSRIFENCGRVFLVNKIKQLLAESDSSSSSDDEDCSSSSRSHSVLTTSYASYLKELFMSMSHSHTSQQWTHLPQCDFIQLAMIQDEELQLRRGGPEEQMIRLAQQGKIETILGHKIPIDLHNLFSFPPKFRQPLVLLPPPPPGRVCLLEGAPGGGKSTIALHICHQWAEGASWLETFDVVVLAYLRDEAIQNAETLADILPASSVEMFQSEIVHKIQASYGERVLFIFDGWDEFPPNRMRNSLVSTIIRRPEKVHLHRSTILITSRPVSSGNLLHLADQRVEILGFTQHQIHEYIERSLYGNPSQIQKLLQHLEDHPVIEGYCYIPLHSAILVHIFLTMNGALPTTHHELFCSLVLCCIVRELAKHESDINLPEFSSLDDLPYDLKSKLDIISVLAYNGVMQNKIIFYTKDLLASHLSTDLPSLGLLQAVEGLTLYSKSLSYNFLHLSVQELLAAYHISHMQSSEQVQVFKDMFKSPRFQAVLHYYCGFTKLENQEIKTFISVYQQYNSSLREILPLLHCFFEAQQPSLCQLVDPMFIHQELINSERLVPVDFLAISYFVISLTSISNAQTLFLLIKNIDDHQLKLLLSELSKCPLPTTSDSLSRKLVLHLETPSITGLGLKYISSHLEYQFTIFIDIALIQNAVLPEHSAHNLHHIQLQYYKQDSFAFPRTLENVGFGLQFVGPEFLKITSFIVSLLSTTAVSSVCLQIKFINDHNLNLLLSELSKYFLEKRPTSLGKIVLCLMTITEQGTRHLASHLKEYPTIGKLRLSHGNIQRNNSEDGLLHIAEALQTNSSLTRLSLCFMQLCYTEQNGLAFMKMLQVNKSLTHLDLSSNTFFSDFGSLCIFEGLQNNGTLVYLNLSVTGLSATNPDTAKSLTKMLQVNKSLTHLDLSNNFTPNNQIIMHVFRGLEHNSTLLHLNLRDTVDQITHRDAEYFARILKCNSSLHSLDIAGWNVCSDQSACLILSSLTTSTSLNELYVTESPEIERASRDLNKTRKDNGLPPINIIILYIA